MKPKAGFQYVVQDGTKTTNVALCQEVYIATKQAKMYWVDAGELPPRPSSPSPTPPNPTPHPGYATVVDFDRVLELYNPDLENNDRSARRRSSSAERGSRDGSATKKNSAPRPS